MSDPPIHPNHAHHLDDPPRPAERDVIADHIDRLTELVHRAAAEHRRIRQDLETLRADRDRLRQELRLVRAALRTADAAARHDARHRDHPADRHAIDGLLDGRDWAHLMNREPPPTEPADLSNAAGSDGALPYRNHSDTA